MGRYISGHTLAQAAPLHSFFLCTLFDIVDLLHSLYLQMAPKRKLVRGQRRERESKKAKLILARSSRMHKQWLKRLQISRMALRKKPADAPKHLRPAGCTDALKHLRPAGCTVEPKLKAIAPKKNAVALKRKAVARKPTVQIPLLHGVEHVQRDIALGVLKKTRSCTPRSIQHQLHNIRRNVGLRRDEWSEQAQISIQSWLLKKRQEYGLRRNAEVQACDDALGVISLRDSVALAGAGEDAGAGHAAEFAPALFLCFFPHYCFRRADLLLGLCLMRVMVACKIKVFACFVVSSCSCYILHINSVRSVFMNSFSYEASVMQVRRFALESE